MPTVEYITKSDKPYPAWIKEHRVFNTRKSIDKVFPKIGLPNFTQPITIYTTSQATSHAREVVYYVRQRLTAISSYLNSALNEELILPSSRERNEKCNDIQAAINIVNATNLVFNKEQTSVVNFKVVLAVPADIFTGASSTPFVKKGEGFFKVVNKLNTLLSKYGASYKIDVESNQSFKEFSKLNVPNKDLKMTFASSGSDGAWDIATASMRGIVSCQAWTATQSRGLIGSISSKYVGIVYISGKSEYAPYGKQMIFRSMVRLVVHKTTGIPALFVDTTYPSFNLDMYAEIKKILEIRSGLKVFSQGCGEVSIICNDYYLLNEDSRSLLREGEHPYMDNAIRTKARSKIILPSSKGVSFSERKKFIFKKIEDLILSKRQLYIKNVKELQEFLASGEKDESKKPNMVPVFQDLKKGQYSFQNMLNFFRHFELGHATTSNPIAYFLFEIFKQIGEPTIQFETNKQIDFWILKNIVNRFEEIKKESWKELSTGSWMKSFPASSKRFHETVLLDLKKELLILCKAK